MGWKEGGCGRIRNKWFEVQRLPRRDCLLRIWQPLYWAIKFWPQLYMILEGQGQKILCEKADYSLTVALWMGSHISAYDKD